MLRPATREIPRVIPIAEEAISPKYMSEIRNVILYIIISQISICVAAKENHS